MRRKPLLTGFGWRFAFILLITGCESSTPIPPDKSQAISVLRTVLETWQKGEKIESLLQRNPSIQAVDSAWSQGIALSRFEIEEEQVNQSGFDMGCPVKIWLNDGKKESRRVRYTIAAPASGWVVTRDFGG